MAIPAGILVFFFKCSVHNLDINKQSMINYNPFDANIVVSVSENSLMLQLPLATVVFTMIFCLLISQSNLVA